MRRVVVPTLAALAMALLSVVVFPAAAGAATGPVRIKGTHFENPSGCFYMSQVASLLEIENYTDEAATVHLDPYCTGLVTGEVQPGETATFPGKSVSLP